MSTESREKETLKGRFRLFLESVLTVGPKTSLLMQACLVKCAPQPNVQDNCVQSSASYQIQQKQLADVQLLLPETM